MNWFNSLHVLFHLFALVGVLWCVYFLSKLIVYAWPKIDWAGLGWGLFIYVFAYGVYLLGWWKTYELIRGFL